MTDEQLKELAAVLRQPDRSPFQKLLDSALGTLVAAVTVGFFALLWNSTRDADREIDRLQDSADQIQVTLQALQETFRTEIGTLSAKSELAGSYKSSVESQREAILDIQGRLTALEKRIAVATPDGSTLTPVTNRWRALDPLPAQTTVQIELLESARRKEQSIDDRIRQYEQRALPRK